MCIRDSYEGVTAGLTGIIVHILLQPGTIHQVTSVTDPTKVSTAYQVGGVIDRAWLGGKGMVLSIIVGLLVGWIYTGFMRRNITIKMPEQVPENVAASFTSLVPAGAIIALAGVVHGITTIGFNTTFIELVYKWIQTPLQHVTDGPVGVFVIAFMPVFIWWFGVHGATIIGGIMGPLLQANSADNAALYKAGHLSLSNGAHIVTFWWGARYYFRSNAAVYQMDHDLDNYTLGFGGVGVLATIFSGGIAAAVAGAAGLYFQKMKSDLDYYNNTHLNNYINMDVDRTGYYSIYAV